MLPVLQAPVAAVAGVVALHGEDEAAPRVPSSWEKAVVVDRRRGTTRLPAHRGCPRQQVQGLLLKDAHEYLVPCCRRSGYLLQGRAVVKVKRRVAPFWSEHVLLMAYAREPAAKSGSSDPLGVTPVGPRKLSMCLFEVVTACL